MWSSHLLKVSGALEKSVPISAAAAVWVGSFLQGCRSAYTVIAVSLQWKKIETWSLMSLQNSGFMLM